MESSCQIVTLLSPQNQLQIAAIHSNIGILRLYTCMFNNFYHWLQSHDVDLFEYLTIGHSEDWSDQPAADKRLNNEKYARKGVRSKYVATMIDEKQKKKKSAKTK